MRSCGTSKWSLGVQEALIAKIAPEFEKKFPHLRLGISALKKIWEKIAQFLSQIQDEKEALTQEGKLNLTFFIRKNLKSIPPLSPYFHPSVYSHQLAVKMSEYVAVIDGVKPRMDHLTRTIWSLQKHLLQNFDLFHAKSPYDTCDKIDKLIIKLILEITVKEPEISQPELEYRVKESLLSLQELPSFACIDTMTANIATLLAEKLHPHFSFQTALLEEEKNTLFHFLHHQLTLCKKASPSFQHTDWVRRVLALYTLASQLPKNLNEQDIRAAVKAVYPTPIQDRPPLPQALYAFISAEILLARTEEYCHSVEYACQTILHAYNEAKKLPYLENSDLEFLEIAIWKMIGSSESLLEKLPYSIGHRIEEELAHILIDDPKQTFNGAIHKTVKFFQQIKELTSLKKCIPLVTQKLASGLCESAQKSTTAGFAITPVLIQYEGNCDRRFLGTLTQSRSQFLSDERYKEIEQKIHTWVIQNDMIYRVIRLDADHHLLKLIRKKAHELSHRELICEVTHSYLTKHPELLNYTPQIQSRIASLYKYAWYTDETAKEESSFDRFIKWHASHLLSQSPYLSYERLTALIEERCKRMIPLMPFDQKLIPLLVKKQYDSQQHKGNTKQLSHC
jgi:hypothetical protein